ncbi:MAG: DUF2460 domain-containing protein [Erythrobacter sp.]|jgi:uncharacterized protein (TIGR02217 family)|nr:DUF2460 domain-containing protein [Erythrobacter sp.]
MAFWLASQRNGQHSNYIQRFDPRFWTVNFPRPAMASVIATGPDSLQVDVELHYKGDLVGLIWESEDNLDHPLLAYETDRDYSHTTLSFRWQSEGVIPLDQINGPTLTIEGEDVEGQPHTWYVRLWNYAEGLPHDAIITLPFSSLQGGYTPSDPVNASRIDRMFISLVAPDYEGGSQQPLSERFNGQVVLSQINADGGRAMIEIGDVRLPIHGERMATAFDDSYNQTPTRIVRSVIGLGYREDVVHYVGMSHFRRLELDQDGKLLVDRAGGLCTPARVWHSSYYEQCRLNELEVISSISYELFNAYCPEHWKQRDLDGNPALTGWDPPSTLLSPANPDAMAWLRASTEVFVDLMRSAGLPVRVQIGEPWWWTTQVGAICLYDEAAKDVFGGAPVPIADMKEPLSSQQTALLDAAGALLAQSTADLTSAIRTRANGPSEVLLLAFTPTILSADMPELLRANLPLGWAYPAFDRLQLEDYDWLTSGIDGPRRAAYAFVDARLGYPIGKQDYFAGFVLLAEDAPLYWARIDAGLDEAAGRGVSRRYVWALPQVSRDGYTRLAPSQENVMNAFDDVVYPFALGRSTAVAPEFSTSVTVTASGHERRNSLWSDARVHFDVGPGIRSEEELSRLIEFFRARRGAAKGFRIQDPYDYSSNGMTGAPTMLDQLIGVGDGGRTDFQLVKAYGSGEEPQIRAITRPHPDSIVISVAGFLVSDWSLGDLGMIRLASPPMEGEKVRAGFLFDVPVRFAEDRIDISGIDFAAGEAPSIPLVEVREID